jgi:hypothetical protein
VPPISPSTARRVNMSSVNAPARLGSSARRRGAVARSQRATTTTMTATEMTPTMARWIRSITHATSASGQATSRWPSAGSNIIQRTWPSTNGIA